MTDGGASRLTHTATHWGTFIAETRDGRLVGAKAYADDPDPPEIGGGADMVDHPTRIARPSVREGWLRARERGEAAARGQGTGRGAEPFVELPWDEALDLAAAELERVRRDHGNGAIFAGSYGWASAGRFHHAQSQLKRFMTLAGGYTSSVETYSHAAVTVLMRHVLAPFPTVLDQTTAWPVIVEHSDLVVMIGGLARKNAQVTSGGVGRHTMREALIAAKARGCAFVNIGPLRSDAIPEIGAEWMAIRPGADTALLLGLMHTLWVEGLADRAFLDRYTTGVERFLPYLLGETDGQPKDADWAAGLTEIGAEAIRALARRMASGRTMISVAWGLQRAEHGEQPVWAALVLAAMLGQIGLPGGGVGFGYGSENGIGNSVRFLKFPALPRVPNPVEEFIPVARISDALLSPGAPYSYDGQTRQYPDIRMVWWAGGNPFHHHQDLGRLVRALREPETIAVNEIWWTPMARHADIVLPVTTAYEREDIAMTHWEPLIVAMRQAVDPVGEARSDHEICRGLAARMGFEEAFTEGRTPEDWLNHLWDQARQRAGAAGVELPGLEELRRLGTVALPPPERDWVLLEDFRRDPAAHPLPTPSGRIEIFSEEIAGFGYADCPGHPVWIAPDEWLGSPAAARHPLHLISNQPRARLHAQLDPGKASLASKVAGREPVTMHPADAAARGLTAGAVVRVFNDRGACLAGLVISDEVRPGVIQLSTGSWYDPETPGDPRALCKHGNPNVLTRDRGTSSLAQGPSAHSTLVEVAPLDGPPPPVSAHEPPVIVPRHPRAEG